MRTLLHAFVILLCVGFAAHAKEKVGHPPPGTVPAKDAPCECGDDEPPMDWDYSSLGRPPEFFERDLDPLYEPLRYALEIKVSWEYLVAKSLRDYGFPLHYSGGKLGNFVATVQVNKSIEVSLSQ